MYIANQNKKLGKKNGTDFSELDWMLTHLWECK